MDPMADSWSAVSKKKSDLETSVMDFVTQKGKSELFV